MSKPRRAPRENGPDYGPEIRQCRDLERVEIADPDPAHVAHARDAATTRVSRVRCVLRQERAEYRTLQPCHLDAADRLVRDHETGANGGTPPRDGAGRGSGGGDSEQRRLDAVQRYRRAVAHILAGGAHLDVAIKIILHNVAVAAAAEYYHRPTREVRRALNTALDRLVDHYDAARDGARVTRAA